MDNTPPILQIMVLTILIMAQTVFLSCTDVAERDSIYDEKSPDYIGEQSSSSLRSSSSSVRSSSSVGNNSMPSSSSLTSSSSNIPLNILACSAVPGVGTAGAAISPPLVTCNGSSVTPSSWQGAPNWNNPAAGTYSNVKAQAICGGTSKTADCSGTLTVNPAGVAGVLACGNMPSTATAGTMLSPPLVTCDGSNVGAASISWQGVPNAPNWNSLAVGTYNNIRAQASCGGSPKTADCSGMLVVSPGYLLNCFSVPSTGTAGTAISAPFVACSGTPSVVATSISWQGAPSWSNPTAGTYSNIKASASCGGQQLSATCSGTLTVITPVVYSDKGNNISSYRTVQIGEQTWMAENLNYNVSGSKCYGEGNSSYTSATVQANCDKYGRLYNWATAMALPASCNSSTCVSQVQAKHRGICPAGWHIPTAGDWNELRFYSDRDKQCGNCSNKYLRATYDWYNNGNGLDSYGFAALPGGDGDSDGNFNSAGKLGRWWTTTEYDADYGDSRIMDYDDELALWQHRLKLGLASVRCVRDD